MKVCFISLGKAIGRLIYFAALFLFVPLAYAEKVVSSFTLNGSATVTVAPSASITLAATVSYSGNVSGANGAWGSTKVRLNGVDTCYDHADQSSPGPDTASFTITAPSTAGSYNLKFTPYSNNSCGGQNGSEYTSGTVITVEAFSCTQPANTPTGLTLTCYCDNFARATLNPSPIFNSNWIVTTSDATGLLPRIVTPGRMQMTANTGTNAKAATVPGMFPGNGNYISVEFQHYAYPNVNGADGMSLVLSDATVPPVPGASGGSLGYAQKSGTNGFAGGWLGVGIDEFGNFSNNGEGRVGGGVAIKDSIAIRGSGSGTSGYPFLAGTALLSPGIDTSVNPGPGYWYQLIVDARTGSTGVSLNRNIGSGYSSLINMPDVYAAAAARGVVQATAPDTWQISFTGSTGGSTNIHELGNLRVCASTFWPPTGGAASGFNAVDEAYGVVKSGTGTLNYLTGKIFTKVVNTPFKLGIAAIANNNLMTSFVTSGTKSVTVKLVDNADGVCQINNNLADYCSATCKSKVAVTGGSQTLVFGTADKGIKQTTDFTLTQVYKKLVAIVSDGTATACSTDAFVVRPGSFSVSPTTASGTGLTSSAAGATGSPVVKAGSNFSVSATARMPGGVTLATGYDGTPMIDTAKVTDFISGGTAAGLLTGNFSAANPTTGISTATDFKYSEVGYVVLAADAIYDSLFATQVDTGDCVAASSSNTKDATGKYGCKIGSAATSWGRFIPDHFDVSSVVLTDAHAATGKTAFTYFGEDGVSTAFTLTAKNVTNGTTANYAGSWAKLPLTAWQASPASSGSPGYGFAASGWSPSQPAGASLVAGAVAPTGSWLAGVASVVAKHKVLRPTVVYPALPPAPTMVSLTALPVDSDGVTVPSALALGDSLQRFGRLRMSPVFGAVAPLKMPIEPQYWGGKYWVTNSDDVCSTGTVLTSVVYAFDQTGWATPTGISCFSSGSNYLSLLPSNPSSKSLAANLTANLSALPWLRSRWGGSTGYDQDPSARATLGIYAPEHRRTVHIRETF